MKSKSFDLKPSSAENRTLSDKTLDFVGLYKSVADTNKVAEKRKSDDITNKETLQAGAPKRELSRNREKKRSKQEPVDISHINIDGSNLNLSLPRSSPVDDSKVTSTPNTSGRNQSVKSIMKTRSPAEAESYDSAWSSGSSAKPKKRNKSVSFMLEENEEVLVKRTKSDDTKVSKKPETAAKSVVKDKKKNLKKLQNIQQTGKENKAAEVNNVEMEVDSSRGSVSEKMPTKFNKTKKMLGESPPGDAQVSTHGTKEKKKFKKVKKPKSEQSTEATDAETNGEASPETKLKKLKKKKVKLSPTDSTEAEGEPSPKARKQDRKPDIAEDLEHLSIGDNAHTLTNLLDEMTVGDKDKRKELRKKFNKKKKAKGAQNSSKEESEKSDEVKEKVKWKKRKWNKDKKKEADEEGLAHTVIVENLPICIMLNYKKLLTDHFIKHGLIRKIG